VHGVNDLSTKHVFNYFAEFAPAAVEWINDESCNVIWLDKISPVRALLKLTCSVSDAGTDARDVWCGPEASQDTQQSMSDVDELNLLNEDDVAKLELRTVTAQEHEESMAQQTETGSKPHKVTDEDDKMETESGTDSHGDDDDEDDDRSTRRRHFRPTADTEAKRPPAANKHSDSEIPWPQGHWRLGHPCPQAKWIFLRFATKEDKKVRGAGRHSDYYRKHGNPSFGGMKGLISASCRRRMFNRQHQQPVDRSAKNSEQEVDEKSTESVVEVNCELSKRRRLQHEQERDSGTDSSSDSVSFSLSDTQLSRLKEPKYRM
jgi:hypothetical protein